MASWLTETVTVLDGAEVEPSVSVTVAWIETESVDEGVKV